MSDQRRERETDIVPIGFDLSATAVNTERDPQRKTTLSKYVVRTTVSSPTQKIDINHQGPHTLFEHAAKYENLLGILPGGEGEVDWACVLPLQQPERGEGVFTGMNAPLVETWRTLDELDESFLAPNMRFVIEHLEHDDAAVGFNYSQDPRIRTVNGREVSKFKPNSWDHFHMHWLRGVHQMVEKVMPSDTISMQAGPRAIEVRPHRYLSEMLPQVVEDTLRHALRRQDSLGNAISKAVATDEKRHSLPFLPDGGAVFTLPAEDFRDNLGAAIKSIHDSYLRAHSEVWRLFVSNYDEVEKSQWQTPYSLRSSEEIDAHLANFSDNKALQQGMKRYFEALRPESKVPNSMNLLYRGPSYSMALYKHESDYVVSLLPHLMHPTNWLAALGMFEARQGNVEDFALQREYARQHVQKLGAGTSSLLFRLN